MKTKTLITCLLAGGVTAASGTDISSTFALAPPAFLTVRLQKVEVREVCVGPRADYFLYMSSSGGDHAALITGVDGIPRYQQVPVRSENCGDSSLAWPDEAVGFVRASPSASRELPAQLVISAPSMRACHLLIDLPLKLGPECAPPNKGHFE